MHKLRSSLAYVYVPVDPPDGIDPTIYPCKMALITDDGTEPGPGDWHSASWIGGDVALLTGPGSAADFPDGEYFVFAQIDAGIEKPVLPSGRARIGLAAGT